MNPTNVETRPDGRMSRSSRRARRLLAVATALPVLILVGEWWGRGPRPARLSPVQAASARGRSYLRSGRPELALQAVDPVREATPEAGEAMAVAGLALIEMGHYRAARLALERALTLRPDQFEVAVTLGELNLDLGNARRGSEVLEMAARLRPREFGVWRILGRALDDLDDRAGAERAYRKALEVRPEDREVLRSLVALLVNNGQSDRAGPWVNRALRVAPDDPVVLGLAAQAAFDTKRIDEAISLADRAIERAPRNIEALLARARCRVTRSDWQAARADAALAASAGTDDPAALQLLGMIESRLGETDRAREALARARRAQERRRQMSELSEQLEAHPDDPEIPWKMGQLAAEAGSALLASRCFEACLALDPDHRAARESLAALRAAHPELGRDAGPAARPDLTSRIPRPALHPAR